MPSPLPPLCMSHLLGFDVAMAFLNFPLVCSVLLPPTVTDTHSRAEREKVILSTLCAGLENLLQAVND